MRIYLPGTIDDLEALAAGQSVSRGPLAYAATDRLAAEFPDADAEELAYAAMSAAAADCAEPPLIVVAADVPATETVEAGIVEPTEPVSLGDVASFHLGDSDDPEDELAWYATQELDDLIANLRSR